MKYVDKILIYVEKFRYVCFKKACRKHARDTYSYGPKSKRLFKRTVFSPPDIKKVRKYVTSYVLFSFHTIFENPHGAEAGARGTELVYHAQCLVCVP